MKIIKNKVGLTNLAQRLGNISKACKIMGYSRETCYCYQEAVERGGVEALLEKSRRNRPNLRRCYSNRSLAALEKKKDDDLACTEIETAHPGYLGSQDTFSVGNLKSAGRIYQQTFVDTCSKIACPKRYTTKTPITATDLLNDKALPLLEANGMAFARIN